MKKSFLLISIFPSMMFAQSQRQTVFQTPTADCFIQAFTPIQGGGNLLTGYSRFGSDSSQIDMVFLNDSDEMVSHNEFNTATQFDFANDVMSTGSGYLIAGKSSDPSFFHPQLIKTDQSGNVVWAKYFDNTSYWHSQLIRILQNGAQINMYTFAETPFNDFYRIETDVNGSFFTGKQYVADTAMSFRVFDADAKSATSSHILGGHANFNSNSTRGGLLMKADQAGISWAKHITSGGNFKNDIVDVLASTDGNNYSVFVCENMPGNQYSTIIMKFDSAGNKTWAKQLSISNGTANGCSIIESSSHEFYVALYDNLLIAYLCKFDASGNMLWTHKWNPSQTNQTSALKLFKDASGNIVFAGKYTNDYFVARLDANGNGCNFSNSSAVLIANANLVITPVSFTTTAFTPNAVNASSSASALTYQENLLCGGVGVNDVEAVIEFNIFPNPVQGVLNIPGAIMTGNSTIEIFNALGKCVLKKEHQHSTRLNVESLSNGVYFLRIIADEKTYTARFVVE